MIVYKNYVTFQILDNEINLISDETDYGINTVAEVKDKYYYMGSEPCNIATAIFVWQEMNDKILTDAELQQVMLDNNLISAAY